MSESRHLKSSCLFSSCFTCHLFSLLPDQSIKMNKEKGNGFFSKRLESTDKHLPEENDPEVNVIAWEGCKWTPGFNFLAKMQGMEFWILEIEWAIKMQGHCRVGLAEYWERGQKAWIFEHYRAHSLPKTRSLLIMFAQKLFFIIIMRNLFLREYYCGQGHWWLHTAI